MIKILIAEDEQGILNSIYNAFSWENMGCEITGLAQNGIQALEFCLTNPPDIIISDIVMPGIDGLTFLKYIKEKYPSIHFIVLTGHRNFEYAQNALNLGAALFLLKPVNFKELEDALKKIIESLLEEKKTETLENRQEYILGNLLRGHIYSKSEFSPRFQLFLDSFKYYRICTFQFDDNQENDIFRIQNLALFCEQKIPSKQYISIKMDETHFILIVLGKNAAAMDSLTEMLRELQTRIYHFFHTTISIGISAEQTGYHTLHQAYTESLIALAKKFFSGNQSLHFYLNKNNDSDLEHADYNAVFRYQDKIESLISNFSGVILNQNASELFSEWIHSFNGNISLIKSSFIITAVICIQKIVGQESKQTALLLEKYSNFQKIIRCDTLDELKDIYLNLVMDLNEYRSIKTSNKQQLINEIFNYINNHYQEALSLSTVAKTVYLSPSYLSSLITNETGKNFTEIVNEVRILKAIELLKDPKRKIADIAYLTGFNEPQYFSIMFKKITKLTPRDYRELYLKK